MLIGRLLKDDIVSSCLFVDVFSDDLFLSEELRGAVDLQIVFWQASEKQMSFLERVLTSVLVISLLKDDFLLV